MVTAQSIVATIKAGRSIVLWTFLLGLCAAAALNLWAPSQLSFMLVGPLVMLPWAFVCVALARAPSTLSLCAMAGFALVGLAWPVICLL